MSKIRMKEALIALAMLPAIAHATYSCTGPVNGVAVEARTGIIRAANAGGLAYQSICSVSSTNNLIDPTACKSIYALLLTAQTTNQQVTMYFDDAGGSCSSHAAWAPATGLYFVNIVPPN